MTAVERLAAARAYLAERRLAPRCPVGTRYAGVERSYSTRREAWQALNLRRLMEGKS